ncbi:RNA polymerase sigma-70 factor [Fulvivirga sediminis]|uniref:RNA polymerase sigma-70 factor n=1 Tax=Fulvivirga sediminis TaxID=2803949 RepID=A0A937F2Y1_9BACT|nr:RNA polymerase sigma-70 factor [Fulvivirga sediminis]MBL3655352.1 RNA polymerase sigma-70 factor [Fulvivirga sediminis]
MPEQNLYINSLLQKINNDSCQQSFRRLFDIYHAQLLQYAGFLTGNREIAEEVVSEVFVYLWKNRLTINEIRKINSFLYLKTKHLSIDHLRKVKDLSCISIDQASVLQIKDMANPEGKLIHKEWLLELERVINALPERCQLIYRLIKEEGMKYEEAASFLDVSKKTVENQMGIATKRLREAMKSYLAFEDKKQLSKFYYFFF